MLIDFKSKAKYIHLREDFGVIIIFIIVTLVFVFSLSQSTYGKKFLSQRTTIEKQERIVSLH